ncbi:MAG: SoxR reducing system RseC family protein [Bacteroidota bacterium]
MQGTEEIVHNGVIQSIENGVISVVIPAKPACASCKVKGACGLTETNDKIIEIPLKDHGFQAGEDVIIGIGMRSGFLALFLGYILPFIVMGTTLIITLLASGYEGLSAVLSIGILAVYYLFLFRFRNIVAQKFSFSIRKQYA